MNAPKHISRLLVVLMIMASVMPAGAGAAQDDPSTQLKPISHTGDYGTVFVKDTPTDGAVGCLTRLLTTQPKIVEINVRGPVMIPSPVFHAQNPLALQKVSWQVFFFEVNANNTNAFLLTSAEITGLTGFDFGWKHFGPNGNGPKYVVAVRYRWYNLAGTTVVGTLDASPENYVYMIDRDSGMKTYDTRSTCTPALKPVMSLSPSEGTVKSTMGLGASYFPIAVTVKATFDGASLASFTSGADGRVTGTFKIPDATAGTHTIKLTHGAWTSTASLLVKARIRVTPTEAAPGTPVVLNLTGFHASEAVTIKWKKGTTWVTVATTTVSTKGTRNKTVTVPAWATAGTASIRGIGSAGTDVKTNGLTVPAALPDSLPATSTPIPEPTATPTLVPTATATPELTASPIPDPTWTPTEPPEATSTLEPVPTSEPLITPDPVLDPTPEATPEA